MIAHTTDNTIPIMISLKFPILIPPQIPIYLIKASTNLISTN